MSDLDSQNEELRGGHGRRETGGASIQGYDPRVSRAVSWLLVAVGSALVAVGGWIGTNIYQLNITVARVVDKTDALLNRIDRNDTRDDRQDADINTLARDLSQLEGRTLRGHSNDAMEQRRER